MNSSMDPGHIAEWLLAFALTLVAVAVVVRVARLFWDAKRTIDEAALDVAVKRHPAGSKLPGPGRPQPSGVGRHDETGTGTWTDAELAFLRGHRETPDE